MSNQWDSVPRNATVADKVEYFTAYFIHETRAISNDEGKSEHCIYVVGADSLPQCFAALAFIFASEIPRSAGKATGTISMSKKINKRAR